MALLEQDFIDSLVPDTSASDKGSTVFVTIRVDGDSCMLCDGEFIDVELKANKLTKVELNAGQHILEFKSVADPGITVEKIVDYPEKGKSYLELVQGLAEKSKEEKKQDSIDEFKKLIEDSLEDDSRIDAHEGADLEYHRKKLGIAPDLAKKLINEARRNVRKSTAEPDAANESTFSVDVMKDAIRTNNASLVGLMLPNLGAIIESSDQETDESSALQCIYYMCMTALKPKALIGEHESSYVDNYWRTFWVYVAYLRENRRQQAAGILGDLQTIYADYPSGNIGLLRAIDALNNIGAKEAKGCVLSAGADISDQIAFLADSLKLELGIASPFLKSKASRYDFIRDLVISFDSPEERAAKKEKAKEELRKQVTYTLSIAEVNDSRKAMEATRKSLGWATSVSTCKFTHLPVDILVTDDKSQALSMYKTFKAAGMLIKETGVNGLGEEVSDCLGIAQQKQKAKKEFLKRKEEKEQEEKRKREEREGYVDLGLSVMWASRNLGARSPEEFGNYYAWGVTEPAKEGEYASSWRRYKFFKNDKYAKGANILESVDDAARSALGYKWRMPSKWEFEELMENCTCEWTTVKGARGFVKGFKFTSRVSGYTDKSIFLPAAGYIHDMLKGFNENCNYWSSTRCDDEYYAESLEYGNNEKDGEKELKISRNSRSYGLSIRPVHEK